ncbi:MAG: glycosyltransferase family 4 protein [Gammaproteobacteria bacterium]|nr:glycosyltransferase family 4 protein [Gammaproteobacteria bacterium]
MKIVAFSLNPLFANKVNGGGTRNLQKVVTHLGQLGHDVRVLSTARGDTNEPFQWHPNVTVEPCLRFKQPFPGPYEISHHDMAFNIQVLGDALMDADRFYLHDGEWLCPHVHDSIPTVVSLRDNVYPESMLGGFNFRADTLIAISPYSRDLYLATIGRSNRNVVERLRTIPNGIDAEFFSYQPPSPTLLEFLRFNPAGRRVVLHPHRPESSKGMWQTIDVAQRLVFDKGVDNLSVLVPMWFDVDISEEVSDFYESVKNGIDERGLTANFHFHPWLPQELIAQYYSLGEVTLALGHFVEAFGNVPYESMSCGTPAVVARVATHRSLMPDELVDKVDYNDVDAALERTYEILRSKARTSAPALAYIREQFGVERQLDDYADAIVNAEFSTPRGPIHRPLTVHTRYKLAPWCYQSGPSSVYHDFRAEHVEMPALTSLLAQTPTPTARSAEREGVDRREFESWYEEGFTSPLVG